MIAALDDGRFHEVRRRVPSATRLPGIFRNNRWKKASNGKTILPTIEYPKGDVTEGMALLPRDTIDPTVPAFYMDTTEFTAQQFSRTFRKRVPLENNSAGLPGDSQVRRSVESC